jgi:hypothetical protein
VTIGKMDGGYRRQKERRVEGIRDRRGKKHKKEDSSDRKRKSSLISH